MRPSAKVTERVRRAVYDAFAATGRCPSRTDLPALLGIGQGEADHGLAELAASRQLALDPTGEVVMAHPFTSINLNFSVMGEQTCGGAAARGTASPCPTSSPTSHGSSWRPRALAAEALSPGRCSLRPSGRGRGRALLVPMQDCWVDVVHTCRHQRLFCSEDCVEAWLTSTGNTRGYVMDLVTLGGWRGTGTPAGSTRRTRGVTLRARPATSVRSVCTAGSGASTTDGRADDYRDGHERRQHPTALPPRDPRARHRRRAAVLRRRPRVPAWPLRRPMDRLERRGPPGRHPRGRRGARPGRRHQPGGRSRGAGAALRARALGRALPGARRPTHGRSARTS